MTAKTASEKVAMGLRQAIFNAVYVEGERLPTERALSQEYGVSRNVVREALKRLQAVGLVRIRQGSGCYVNDIEFMGGMELLEDMLTKDEGHIDLALAGDILEFRTNMVRDVVRLAAERRSEAHVEELRRIVEARPRVFGDVEQLNELNTRMFQALAAAAGNRVYQLALNSLARVFARIRERVPVSVVHLYKQQQLLERTLEAVAQQDPEAAIAYFEEQAAFLKDILAQLLSGRAPQ